MDMKKLLVLLCAGALAHGTAQAASNYSTGAVASYMANCGVGPDLPLTIPEAANFRAWYDLGHFTRITTWQDGDVWGSDFRDGASADSNGSGGSDITQVYFYTGHGICQNPPVATDPDFIVVCGNFGKPDITSIGASSRWGSASGGQLQFLLLDASCPMDLVSITNNWFSPFGGLHIATGHSGNAAHDTLDSASRGGSFASQTVGFSVGPITIIPKLPVTYAWMNTGLIEVQDQVCAVSVAAGATEAEAIDRRENEMITDNRSDPANNWLAWRWVCK